MAGFAIAVSTQAFTAAAILICLVVLCLIFVNLRLLIYYPASWTDPFDYLLLHAPARLFLLVTSNLFLPLTILIAIGKDWTVPSRQGDLQYPWEGFAVVATVGILATIIAAWRRDLVWSAGTVWLLWSVGGLKSKSTPVMVRAR
jgi:hypothetical protein